MTHPHTCGGCTNTWTGLAQAHCSVCHQTFGGVTSFDRHRLDGACRHPSTIGLTVGTRGVWSEPFSWQRPTDNPDEPLEHVLHAYQTVETRSIYADPTTIKTTIVPAGLCRHGNVADICADCRNDTDDLTNWLHHGHEDDGDWTPPPPTRSRDW